MAQWMDQVAEEALEKVESQKKTIVHWHQRAYKAEAKLVKAEALLAAAKPRQWDITQPVVTRDELAAALASEGGEVPPLEGFSEEDMYQAYRAGSRLILVRSEEVYQGEFRRWLKGRS